MYLAANGGGGFPLWAYFAIIIAIIYFLILRPHKRQEQDRRRMLDDLKKGARVVTIGGIFGKVASMKDSEVVLRVDRAE